MSCSQHCTIGVKEMYGWYCSTIQTSNKYNNYDCYGLRVMNIYNECHTNLQLSGVIVRMHKISNAKYYYTIHLSIISLIHWKFDRAASQISLLLGLGSMADRAPFLVIGASSNGANAGTSLETTFSGGAPRSALHWGGVRPLLPFGQGSRTHGRHAN